MCRAMVPKGPGTMMQHNQVCKGKYVQCGCGKWVVSIYNCDCRKNGVQTKATENAKKNVYALFDESDDEESPKPKPKKTTDVKRVSKSNSDPQENWPSLCKSIAKKDDSSESMVQSWASVAQTETKIPVKVQSSSLLPLPVISKPLVVKKSWADSDSDDDW